ncbi:MAG: hypothetical protein EOP37_06260 [Rubrivivax sp.]|nr:MAG: hypothetical protein EOP37_06260 [Rubrivivax sp.]
MYHPLALPKEHAFALTQPRFQHSLPEDCLPGDATLRRQPVYRIVKSNPPSSLDFRTHAELGIATKADPCRRQALSVFSSWREARHRQMNSPHLGRHIAAATLTPMHGPISRPHSSGHMDWWPFHDMLDTNDFEVHAHDH